MSVFVTVTFDLNYAQMSPYGTDVYRKITEALDAVDYSKYVAGKKKRHGQLPANTYVAEFEGEEGEKASEIVAFVEEELRDIFARFDVCGHFFVSAGRKWAWKRGSF